MPVLTSIQLFSVNEALKADLGGTLALVAARGFTAVEAYDFVHRAQLLADALIAHGLRTPTGHAFLASLSFVNPDGSASTIPVPSLDEVFDAATTLGMSTVIDPYTAPDRWTSIAQIEETADLLSRAADLGSHHGIRVGYHNHAHELEATFGDRTGLEVLADFLDPRVVLEVDLYWVACAGVDSPTLLKTLGERVIAVHVKDGRLDPEAMNAYPPTDQVSAGQGKVPLVEALAAASALEYAILEFDHFDGDLFNALEQSRLFLEKVLG